MRIRTAKERGKADFSFIMHVLRTNVVNILYFQNLIFA